jgi:hypothetical protein
MQFFQPENWYLVHAALRQAGRRDLIGDGPGCLIPAQPPREAREARRRDANRATRARAELPVRPRTVGYRPHRAGGRRRG